jgi:hypothetical protein
MSRGRFIASSARFIAALSRLEKYGRRFNVVRGASILARERMNFVRERLNFALSRLNPALSRLSENGAASFGSESLRFLERDASTKNQENIPVGSIDKSIHR